MQAFDIKSPMGYDNLLCNGNQTAAVICQTEKASRLASYSLPGPDKSGKKKACGNILVWICHTPVGEYLLTVLCLCLVSAVAKEAQQIQEEVDKVEIQVQRA